MAHRVDAVFGDQIALLGYDATTQGAEHTLTLYWQAVGHVEGDWTVFVHVYDPANEAIVSQWDAPPLQGIYPTSWWREGEVVSDPVLLDLSGVAPGEYRLAVGLYDAQTWVRLPIVDASGAPVPGDRLVLEQTVDWPAPE
jgi:hypothetical protein